MADWKILQEQLQDILSKEIKLRQEILGNMNQQEYLLATPEMMLKQDLYNESSLLVKELRKIIKLRGIITRKLLDHLPSNIEEGVLNKIINPLIDIDGETLLLYQRTKELIDKIHSQHLRNKALYAMIPKEKSIQTHHHTLKAESILKRQNRKPTLMTIEDHPER